jgi:hypothetical protein
VAEAILAGLDSVVGIDMSMAAGIAMPEGGMLTSRTDHIIPGEGKTNPT